MILDSSSILPGRAFAESALVSPPERRVRGQTGRGDPPVASKQDEGPPAGFRLALRPIGRQAVRIATQFSGRTADATSLLL